MGENRHRTASTTSAQPRQPKGTRDGGQYAPTINPESSVQLVDQPDVDADVDGIAETERIARNFIRRYGLHDHTVNGYMDSDDVIQGAVLAYLVASATDRPDGVELPVGVIAKRSMLRAFDSGFQRSRGNYVAGQTGRMAPPCSGPSRDGAISKLTATLPKGSSYTPQLPQ